MKGEIRKQIRLRDFDYSKTGAYFLTICTADRQKLFWNKEAEPQITWNYVGANCVRPSGIPLSQSGKIVCEEIERWQETYSMVLISAYVIMPDHVHLIVVIEPDENGRTQFAPTISRMVKQFKGIVTKRLRYTVWQKSFYDHVIRHKNDYNKCVKYIMENPLKVIYAKKP